MRLHPTPPSIPTDLLERFGEPEHVFGPNMRFRFASALMGVFLTTLGFAFFVWGMADVRDGPKDGTGRILCLLGGGLMTVGAAAFILPRRVPLNWVFVCPNGLIRARGDVWDNVDWLDIARFECANFSGTTVTIRQCKIVTTAGVEWGFISDWIADYNGLTEVLREKVDKPS